MSEAKHTPGPWRVSYERGTTQILTADNESIMCDETYYPWVPKNDADWHLIAAAPDLLEALAPLDDAARDRAADAPEWQDADTVSIVVTIGDLRKALAVIAKAKGDQQ